MDELLAIVAGSGGPTNTKYVHANHLYSVAALNDNVGAVVERYRYDAYGQRTVLAADGVTMRTGSSYGNQVGFTGRYLDKETGLWYFRARYFSGGLGRFIGRDPLEYADGTNLYMAYFIPNAGDPYGESATERYTIPEMDPSGNTGPNGGPRRNGIDPVGTVTVTLSNDASTKCKRVPDSSKGNPSDPNCPTKCDGTFDVTVSFDWEQLNDDRAMTQQNIRGTISSVGNNQSNQLDTSDLPAAPPAGSGLPANKGKHVTGSVVVASLKCDSSGKESGTVNIQRLGRARPPATGMTPGLVYDAIEWSLERSPCGSISNETISMSAGPGSRRYGQPVRIPPPAP